MRAGSGFIAAVAALMERGQSNPSLRQLNLQLAWALTIHKFQGLSMPNDNIEITGERNVSIGLTYVGLSRCKDQQGLPLANGVPFARLDTLISGLESRQEDEIRRYGHVLD